jgi:hypothetical protein
MNGTGGSNIGQRLQEGKRDAIKAMVYLLAILVYTVGVIYAEVHGYSLLVNGIDPDLLVWAIVGIFALGITALGLPLGLHFAFHEHKQRLVAFLFYAIDLVLLFANAVMDNQIHQGQELASWGKIYITYVVPANPVIVALGWSILLLLDPSQKMHQAIEEVKASAAMELFDQIVEETKSEDVAADVQQAARIMARDIVRASLGTSMRHAARLADKSRTNVLDLPPSAIKDSKPAGEGKRSHEQKRKWMTFNWPKRKENGHKVEAQPPDPTNQRQA